MFSLFLSLFIGMEITMDGPDIYTIMNSDGANVMLSPSKNSKVLTRVNYGELVWSDWWLKLEIEKDIYVKDTINGIEGYWIDVWLKYDEHISGNPDGYIFSPYLYFGDLVRKDSSKFKIEYEGNHYGQISYDTDLMWYGFYRSENTYLIKQVDLKLSLSCVDTSYRNSENYYKSDKYDHDSRSKILSTQDTILAEYFIGTNLNMKLGIVKTLFSNLETGTFGNNNENFLYPNEQRDYTFNGKRYLIEAFDEKSLRNSTESSTEYKLNLKVFEDQYNSESFIDFSFGRYGRLKEHVGYKSPSLNWVGDLNMDGILDFELKTNSMEDKCGGWIRRNIYLSKASERIDYSDPLVLEQSYDY